MSATNFLAKINAVAAQAVKDGVDMTQAKAGGGGDFDPPAAGPTRLRFIAYIELGKQEHSYQGKKSFRDKVKLVFELSGPKHPPIVLDDGTKMPHRITVEENLSQSEKAHFFKLFTRMNYAGKAQHIAQLLGEAYKGTVVHRKYAKKGEDKAKPESWTGVAVELFQKGVGYTIDAPRYEVVNEDGPTGELALLKVDPPLSDLRCFLWNYADKEMWDGLFIDGEYPERKDKEGKVTAPARSKNVFQNQIKLANNFVGSPIHLILTANGATVDIPDAEDGRDPDAAPAQTEDDIPAGHPAHVDTPVGQAADDALAEVV